MAKNRDPVVIGIAGGIGAGKSAVAKAFADVGCMVVDYDALAAEALHRPEIRDTLVQWWGNRIVDSSGEIDKREVARIVFEDDNERRRLENLIHPLIRRSRSEMMAEAQRRDPPAPAVIVDAPLLYEAGLDRECDAVVFVDAPESVRQDRVRRTRGWDPAELARREASQWPLDRKRALSRFIVENRGELTDLTVRCRSILATLLER